MAAALELLAGIPARYAILPLAMALLALMVFASYAQLPAGGARPSGCRTPR